MDPTPPGGGGVRPPRPPRGVEELPTLPEEWRPTTTYSDWVLRLTPARAQRLVEHLMAEMDAVDEEDADAAAPYVVQVSAFPYPGKVTAS